MKISLLIVISLLTQFSFSQSPKRELRGAWLTTFYNIDWPDNSQNPQQQQLALISMLDNYKEAGINTVFMQIALNHSDSKFHQFIQPYPV